MAAFFFCGISHGIILVIKQEHSRFILNFYSTNISIYEKNATRNRFYRIMFFII
jgi:hypothetical protein